MFLRKKEKPKELIYNDWGNFIVGHRTSYIYLLTFDEELICYSESGKQLWIITETNVAGYPDYQLRLSFDEHYLAIYERFSSELFIVDLLKHQKVMSYDFPGFDIDYGYFAYQDVFKIISAPKHQMISLQLKDHLQSSVSMPSIEIGDCFMYDYQEKVLHVLNYQKHDTYTRDGGLRTSSKIEEWKLFFDNDRLLIHNNVFYSYDVTADKLFCIDSITNTFSLIKLEKKRWDNRFNNNCSDSVSLSTKGHYLLIQRENNLLDIYDTNTMELCLSVGAEHPLRQKSVALTAHKRAIDSFVFNEQTHQLLIMTMEGLWFYNLKIH